MHALQLCRPEGGGRVRPEGLGQDHGPRRSDIQLQVRPAVPDTINAELRPYQVDGFHFLAYLATNRFGGILADDMGLGKTVQSLTYILWLREQARSKPSDSGPGRLPEVGARRVGQRRRRSSRPRCRVQVLRSRDELDMDACADEGRHPGAELRAAARLRRRAQQDQVARRDPRRGAADQEPGFEGGQSRARAGLARTAWC